ncbi:MAG TPA: glycosyltransferase [Gemmataceae bacterium]|nr:glycosyltransferase [Gemmataceae bacterium]
MLCFSHDWTGDPLSKSHLMKLLARDNRVLWVNSIGYRAPTATAADLGRAWRKLKAAMSPLTEPIPNLHVLSPLAIPAWGSPAVRAFNRKFLRWQVRRAMRKLRFKRPINWVFNPAAAVLAGSLGEDRIIYYCVDEYTAFAGVPSESLIEMERGLMQRADVVIVSADRLLQSKSPYNLRTFLVRHGVDFDHFRKALDPATVVPKAIRDLPKPVIGYFGLMSPDWVDLAVLEAAAKHFTRGSVVLLGKVAMDLGPLTKLPNVHVLGRKPYESLPAYCKGFDAAVIPFPVSEVTLNANPLKAREYLAAGLPVVSTPIPEVEVLGMCRIGRTPEEFCGRLVEALASPGPSVERSEAMRTEGWAARLDEVRRHFAALPPKATK